MEITPELIAQAQAASENLQAELASLVAEFNQKVIEAGAKAGVSLSTDVEIQIVKKDEGQE